MQDGREESSCYRPFGRSLCSDLHKHSRGLGLVVREATSRSDKALSHCKQSQYCSERQPQDVPSHIDDVLDPTG